MTPEQEAARLLKKTSVKAPPIPVEAIAKSLGINLVFEPYRGAEEISGMLHRQGDGSVIGVNSVHSKTRQRFTIAHELGHFYLHEGETYIDGGRLNFRGAPGSKIRDREEAEANAFAAALLMPEQMVRDIVEVVASQYPYLTREQASKMLADKFAVSPQAMHLRLVQLGLVGTL